MKKYPTIKYLSLVAGLALACFAGGRLSMLMALIEKDTMVSTTPLWLPMGIGMGALLVFGHACWPGIWLGQLIVSLTTGIPFLVAASISTSSVASMLVSVYFLRKYAAFPKPLDSVKHTLWFVLIGILFCTLLSATLGVFFLALENIITWDQYGPVWWVFWIGDAMGILLVTPLLLAWGLNSRKTGFLSHRLETGILIALILAAMVTIHSQIFPGYISDILYYGIFLFIIWSSLRFQEQGSSVTVVFLAGFITYHTAGGLGPFARETVSASVLSLNGYLAVLSAGAMFLSAVISEKNQSLARVLSSESKLHEAQRIAGMGSFSWNVDTGQVIWSDALFELLGYDKSYTPDIETVNTQIHHPEDADRVNQWLTESIASGKGELTPLEYRIRHRDGRELFVRTTGKMTYHSDKPLEVFATVQDITARRKTENELRMRNQFIETILENLPIGLAVNYFDEGRAVYMNKKFEDIYGWPSEELENIDCFFDKVYPEPEYRRKIQTQIIRDIESGDPERMQWSGIEITTKTGLKKNVSAKNIPIVDQNLMISTVQDTTTQKKLERELIDSREKLRQLAVYLQKLREKDRISIAREIHDDIGQTLSALKMDLGWLEKRILPDQQALTTKITQMKQLILQSVQSVKRLCSELRPGILDDLGLIPALKWHVGQFEERTGIHCHLAVAHEEPVLDKDLSTAIYRITQESLTNALRHAQAKNIRISLAMNAESIVLTILDDGIGIDMDAVDGNRSFGITGMRERVISHDGQFDIHRHPVQGTVITAAFPVKPIPDAGSGEDMR